MKKALIIIAIIMLSFVLLTSGLVGLLHLKSVQTYIIKEVTSKLAEDLEIDINVRQFHYRPLSNLTIDDVYISDQQKDTLAHIEQIELDFNPLQLKDKLLDIDQLTLRNPYINIQTLPDSTHNYQFLVDKFHRDSESFPLRITIDQLKLERSRVRYNDFLIDQLDLDLTLPIFSKDLLEFHVKSMHLRAQVDQLDAAFEANLRGDLDSIFAEDMHLNYSGKKIFEGDLAVLHPTNLDSLYIKANCNYLYCSPDLLTEVSSKFNLKQIKLPTLVTNLKHIEYNGYVEGRIDNTQLHGTFSTPLGKMSIKGTLLTDTTLQNFDFCGKLSTPNFQLGKLLNNTQLGSIAFDAHIDGIIDSAEVQECIAQATIKHISYLDYTYKNIQINGKWLGNEANGEISIDDENIKLNVNGLAEWDQKDTRINLLIDLDDFSPAALHLTKKNPDLRLGMNTCIELYTSGKKYELLDNLDGYVIFNHIDLQNNIDQQQIKNLEIHIDSKMDDIDSKRLRIQSDMITASLTGRYSYQSLPIAIQHILHKNLPTLIEKPKQAFPKDLQIDFYTFLRRIDKLNKVLNLDINIPSQPVIKGHIKNEELSLNATIPAIETKGLKLEDFTVALDNTNEKLNLSMYALTHLPQHNPTIAKLGDIETILRATAHNNNIDINIQLGNTDSVQNSGNINISSLISKFQGKPKYDIQIKPTEIILNDSAWSISPTNIVYTQAAQTVDIQNLLINTDYQAIQAHGKISKSKSDSIKVQLNNIDINYLLTYTDASKVISIQGPVTGSATLYSVLSDMMLNAKAKISNAGINGVYLGDAIAEAKWDRMNKSILINGTVVDSTNHKVADVLGKVFPADKLWILDIDCDSVDVGFIDHWTQGIISNPTGRGYGQVRVRGENREVDVIGRVYAKDAKITIPQIGVTYAFSDSVYLDETAIRFPKIEFYDQYNNKGTFSGNINHRKFLNMSFNLSARAEKLLVMDFPADQQSFFYGKVFGTGDVSIRGDEKNCFINANAKTEANTKFYLNVFSASQASQSNFIEFVKPDTTSRGLLNILIPKISSTPTAQTSKMKLTLAGEVTPQADINIILEGQDIIKGKGEGNLKLIYDYPSEDIQMQGSYVIQSGLFSFSLGNIVKRDFTIREGSRITWENDPMTPTINITGHYHTSASLRDLFGSESAQIATDRNSVPVNCVLNMTDQLFNPILKFAIELPQSDESVQSQVNSMINTEDMLMRQMIYLLVFNRFYTPEYLQNTQNVGLNETYSLLSSTITGQINSWLSKLTDVFAMGFNFRTDGEGATASQEYEANFKLQPVNQLIINGNFGYRYNDLSNRPFFGDLDIQYLLTENGKLRAKAYTHTVDKYSLRQANTVQGLGFVFKHDFNWKKKDKNKINTPNKKKKKAKKKDKENLLKEDPEETINIK
jgi:hypothetical protein